MIFLQIYTVRPGDTLYSIITPLGLDVRTVIADNGLDASGALVVGQSLVLRFPKEVFTNGEGDTVNALSLRTGIPRRTLFRNNYYLTGENDLPEGRETVLRYADTPTKQKIIGAYAYDFIGDTLLRSTISYLTYLMPFTYGFSSDGALVTLDDERLLETAFLYGTRPLMHLSTLTPGGYFSNELAHALLQNRTSVETLYTNILAAVEQKGYAGVDVDFEYLFAEDKEPYVAFITGLAERLHQNGLILVVALPPKVSDDQEGLLYEGIDYAGLGAVADYAFLMTYEWGYRLGPPLAVAPIPNVRRVVEYALSRIPREKLLLGIPNYGYDWKLPYVRGETVAPSLSTVRALEIAREYGAEIEFDENAMSPFFYYTDGAGDEHVVWFEDPRSYAAKIALLFEYDLAGAFIWDLMRENPAGFVTLNGSIVAF